MNTNQVLKRIYLAILRTVRSNKDYIFRMLKCYNIAFKIVR